MNPIAMLIKTNARLEREIDRLQGLVENNQIGEIQTEITRITQLEDFRKHLMQTIRKTEKGGEL